METGSRIELDLYGRLTRLENLVERLENQVKSREVYINGFSAWTVKNIINLQQTVTESSASNNNNNNPVNQSNQEQADEAEVSKNSTTSAESEQKQQQSPVPPSTHLTETPTGNPTDTECEDGRASAERIDTCDLGSSNIDEMETTTPNQQENELQTRATEEGEANTKSPLVVAEPSSSPNPGRSGGLLGGSSGTSSKTEETCMMDKAKLSIVPNPILWNELLKDTANGSQDQPRSGRSSGDGTLTICLDEEGEETIQNPENPAPTPSPGKKSDAAEVVQSMLKPYKVQVQDGTYKAVFTCSFCGKQYKRMASLCKHLMTCVQEMYTGYPRWELRRALTEERYRSDLVRATSPVMTERSQPEKDGLDPQQNYMGPRTSPSLTSSPLVHCKICKAGFPTVLHCKRHILQEHNREQPVQELRLHRPYMQEYSKQVVQPHQSLPFYSQYIPLQNISEYLPIPAESLNRTPAISAYQNSVQQASSYRTIMSVQQPQTVRSPTGSELQRRLNQAPLPPISLLKPSLQQLVERQDFGAQLVRMDASSPKYCCIFCKGNGLLAEFADFASLQAHAGAYHSATIQPPSIERCAPGRNLTIERCTTTSRDGN